MTSIRRSAEALLLAGFLTALLSACGTSGSGPSTPATTGAGPASPTAAAGGNTVTATETEYSIALSTTTFSPGTYTFTVTNQGKFPHNLNVKGPGVAGQVSSTVSPGASGQLTVTLQKGSYELWCSIDSHKDRGMDMTIQVG